MNDSLLQQTRAEYAEHFRGKAEAEAWGPGRVNLIGEHTDYNQGLVLPMAVNRGVVICGQPRTDGKILLYSSDLRDSVEVEPGTLLNDPAHAWADYFKGVLKQYLEAGGKFRGCQALIKGDLPRGAGLSSSAALEIASAVFLEKIGGKAWNDMELVKAAQAAENQFVGVNCGIMDPFSSFLGKESSALLLDCQNLSYRWVSMPKGVIVVVCNTGVKRALASSAYNQRRQECAKGVELLASRIPKLSSLRDVTFPDWERHQDILPELIRKRCRHVLTENQRVLDMVKALEEGDLASAGGLMERSHASLREDYEVSCKELDLLAELARVSPGVFGGRMMGGGFGGCTVNLVKEGAEESFCAETARTYKAKTGIAMESYVFQAAPGGKYFADANGGSSS